MNMQGFGRITDSSGVHLEPWEPREFLRTVTQNEIRYSRGFLQSNPAVWFDSFALHWLSLFQVLGTEVRVLDVVTRLGLPRDLGYSVVVEADGEPAVIAFESDLEQGIAKAVAGTAPPTGRDVLLDYIARRLVSTLVASWSEESPLKCYYISSRSVREVDPLGSVGLRISVAGQSGTIWFGLGSRLLTRFDALWRDRLYCEETNAGPDRAGEKQQISLELAELAIPPAMLIDYMRSGSVIDLELPVSDRVWIKVDGFPWLEGELCQFNAQFAVCVTSIECERREFPEDSTRVSVEIGRAEIDSEAMPEYEQIGAILATASEVSAEAALIISGENVAHARLGQANGRFALRIMSK